MSNVSRNHDRPVTNSGPLEFCLNDGDLNLTNNAGGFVVSVSVDMLGPP